jgi:transcriptional regulator GlxA family with amidase domain
MVNHIKSFGTPRAPGERPLRIAVLAYAGCMGTQVFGISELLRLAADIAHTFHGRAATPFEIEIVGLRGRGVVIAGGVGIATRRPSGRYDLLVVPGLEISGDVDWDATLTPLARECAFLRKTFGAGTPVASVCVGAFLLGEAGLLDGRKATTAWLFAPQLARRYPALELRADKVLLEDAGIITSGAVSSAFDLVIELVKRTLGAPVALATARVSLLPEQRASQMPFVDARLMTSGLPAFSHQVRAWLADRLAEPFKLSLLAAAFCVSTSTLLRRVKAETGQTPLALLQAARVEQSKQLLVTSQASLARITERVGYTDVASFSRLFVRLVGESPARYRRRHGVAA